MTDAIATLAQLPFHLSGRYPTAHIGRCTDDDVASRSAREFFEQVRDLGLGLAALGVKPGDRVGLMCETRPEWILADLAILTIGACSVPIYPTLSSRLAAFILADAAVETVVASDAAQVAKLRERAAETATLRHIVVIDPPDAAGGEPTGDGPWEVGLAEVARRGHQRLMHENGLARLYQEAANAVRPDDLATVIYTSGTTGDPKGVMLTHGAIVANIVDADRMVSPVETDVALSFLPLCHALERAVVYLYLYKGVTVTFAQSLDTVARDMVRVRPTIMTGVPRVFEKLRARVFETVASASAARRALFRWALSVGEARVHAELAGRPVSPAVRLQHRLADRLVLSKIRARLGGRLRFVVSGGAPLAPAVAEFLFAVGVPVLEGYGLTETAPVLTVNPLEAPRLGTVGKALPRVELRIADDGEILARGPNLMRGYYGHPEATAEAIRDGWFHTGDIGALDPDGYLRITDRKKELLVTSGGKNVAPQPIEQRLKQDPLVAEAMLVGDARPYVTALIVPEWSVVRQRAPLPDDLTPETLAERADVRALFEAVVKRVNGDLARYEQVRRFALLPRELTQADGELTPTLKIKRRVVMDHWRDTVAGLYETRPV